MSLIKSFKSFDAEFNKKWKQYVQLHKELDKFRGIEITSKNVDIINKIVSAIQDKYAEIHEILNWICAWHSHALQAINEHKKFMDDLKASGATPEYENPKEEAQA